MRDQKAAEQRRKQARFNDWKLYQHSGRTLADSMLFQPEDYELWTCNGREGTEGCSHLIGYHAFIKERDEKEKKEKQGEKK